MMTKRTFGLICMFCLCIYAMLFRELWCEFSHMSTFHILMNGLLSLLVGITFLLTVDLYICTPPDVSYPLKHLLTLYCFNRLIPGILIRVYMPRFIKQTRRCRKVQEAYLLEQLRANRDTVYGCKYRFCEINSREQYVERMPLIKQSDIAPYCEMIADGGRNIFTKEDPVMMALTTGTTGANCPFPVVGTIMNRSLMYILAVSGNVLKGIFQNSLVMRKSVFTPFPVLGGRTRGGLLRAPITTYFLKDTSITTEAMTTNPSVLHLVTSLEEKTYLLMLFALADRSVGSFQSIFGIVVYDCMTLVENNWQRMVQEIRSGRFHSVFTTAEDIMSQMERYLKPDPVRADELETEFRKGFVGIMKRIWPNMQVIQAITSGSMSLYRDLLNEKYSKGIPMYSILYGATEGYGGINMSISEETPEYVLFPDTSFYEFIEETDIEEDQPRTLFAEQVDIGKNYELVLTNKNGLCRYRFGDVVKVTRYLNTMPVVTMQYRKGQLLNLVSEKTTEVSVLETVIKTIAGWKDCKLHDFTCTVNAMVESVLGNISIPGPYYVFFVELRFKDEQERPITAAEKTLMDTTLRSISHLYDIARANDKIKPIIVHIVQAGSFAALKEFILQTTAASFVQFKMPRVLKRQALVEFMLKRIQKDSNK